jgi:hypothetical protein
MIDKTSVWDRLAVRTRREPEATEPVKGSMGLGRTFMLWLAANMVVTTMLTGTLFRASPTQPRSWSYSRCSATPASSGSSLG